MPLGPVGTGSVGSGLGSTRFSVAVNTEQAAHVQRVPALQAPAPGIGRMNRDLVW